MNHFPKISITGDLGSGKSAVSRILQKETGFRIVSTGSIQREIAQKLGMSTLELNEYTKTHTEIDDEIDGRIAALQHESESLILDSRLAWHFAPASFKVYLLVDPLVGAQRIFGDQRTSEKYRDIEETRAKLDARRNSELERFKTYYGINYSDLTNYDLVVETTDASPTEVAGCIMQAFGQWKTGANFSCCWLSPFNLYPTGMISCHKPGNTEEIEVMRISSVSLITAGHGAVAEAIGQREHLIAVKLKSDDSLLSEITLKKLFLDTWEDFNGIKLRSHPPLFQ